MGVVQHGKTVIVTSIVFPLIAIVAALLRLISKRFVKAGFAADDAWIVAAVVFMIVLEGVQIWSELLSIYAINHVYHTYDVIRLSGRD